MLVWVSAASGEVGIAALGCDEVCPLFIELVVDPVGPAVAAETGLTAEEAEAATLVVDVVSDFVEVVELFASSIETLPVGGVDFGLMLGASLLGFFGGFGLSATGHEGEQCGREK